VITGNASPFEEVGPDAQEPFLSIASATALGLMLPGSVASARRIGPGNDVSSGKAGVTLEEYWALRPPAGTGRRLST
jgi:hypothetical protein